MLTRPATDSLTVTATVLETSSFSDAATAKAKPMVMASAKRLPNFSDSRSARQSPSELATL
jgi:hypothetical protein